MRKPHKIPKMMLPLLKSGGIQKKRGGELKKKERAQAKS